MLNIIISGAPGSGKGTQSDIIVEKYGLTHISTGDLLRKEMNEGTEIGKQADALISVGKLVPDGMIVDLLKKEIKKYFNETKGFIFDGFPRTVTQAVILDEMLKELGTEVTCMLHMEVNKNLLIERLLNRGKTSGRADDNLETIKKRLDIYQHTTMPVADHYKSTNRYKVAYNNGTVEECFEQVKEIIDNLK